MESLTNDLADAAEKIIDEVENMVNYVNYIFFQIN